MPWSYSTGELQARSDDFSRFVSVIISVVQKKSCVPPQFARWTIGGSHPCPRNANAVHYYYANGPR